MEPSTTTPSHDEAAVLKQSPATPESDTRKPPKKKLVQMRFSSATMTRIEHLQTLTGVSNRTQLIASAIQVTWLIMKEAAKGGRLLIESKDGSIKELTIVGLER